MGIGPRPGSFDGGFGFRLLAGLLLFLLGLVSGCGFASMLAKGCGWGWGLVGGGELVYWI